MKGVVFNLLEEAVTEAFGAETWDDLLDDAGVSGAYTSLGNYSDAEIEALVGAAARRLEMEPGAVLRWFGERAMPLLFEHPKLARNSEGNPCMDPRSGSYGSHAAPPS